MYPVAEIKSALLTEKNTPILLVKRLQRRILYHLSIENLNWNQTKKKKKTYFITDSI